MREKVVGCAFLLVLMVVSASPVSGDFYVVPVKPGVGVAISTVPYTISNPGFYYLANNLNYTSTTGAAIIITSPDVTLDLMGFALSGPGKSSGDNRGIEIDRVADVEIRNGAVTDFGSYGIYGAGSDGLWSHRIIGIRTVRNGGIGIALFGKGNVIRNCTSSYNGLDGLYSGDFAAFIGNTTTYNGRYGINIAGHSILDQNISKNNCQTYNSTCTNIDACGNCDFGVNAD